MGFLIRAVFWFSLVLLILPLDSGAESTSGETVGPLQALLAAREAVSDVAGICERKPAVCETGKSAVHTIGVRARAAYEIMDDQFGEPDASISTGSVPAPRPKAPVAANRPR
jgi:hypothetical protein